jgi:hypothetical protein
MTTTNTGSYSRIRYFTSLLERMGEASRGGRANTISNAYASILGGSGNTPLFLMFSEAHQELQINAVLRTDFIHPKG